jgi:hypothetical protein
MRIRRRLPTLLVAASYLLALSMSALPHCHHGHAEGEPRPGLCANHSGDEHECPICQFLAQKPAPVIPVAPVTVGLLVQDVTPVAPAGTASEVFTAWHSRAPPQPE